MSIEYTLDPEDIAAARLLALGIRPRIEFALFAVVVCALLSLSVTPWRFGSLPLLIGLTASLGAFRLIQIYRVREAATAAFHRNSTLRRPSAARWDADGVTLRPTGATPESLPWTSLNPLKESDRVFLLQQRGGSIFALPKRAFADKAAQRIFREMARRAIPP